MSLDMDKVECGASSKLLSWLRFITLAWLARVWRLTPNFLSHTHVRMLVGDCAEDGHSWRHKPPANTVLEQLTHVLGYSLGPWHHNV